MQQHEQIPNPNLEPKMRVDQAVLAIALGAGHEPAAADACIKYLLQDFSLPAEPDEDATTILEVVKRRYTSSLGLEDDGPLFTDREMGMLAAVLMPPSGETARTLVRAIALVKESPAFSKLSDPKLANAFETGLSKVVDSMNRPKSARRRNKDPAQKPVSADSPAVEPRQRSTRPPRQQAAWQEANHQNRSVVRQLRQEADVVTPDEVRMIRKFSSEHSPEVIASMIGREVAFVTTVIEDAPSN
jgi:hypothetical protein